MVGITSYGAYVPWHRIERQQFVKAWGGFAMPGERAIAYYDEDSVTMAVEAAMDCLGGIDPCTVDGLFFATTTAPYKEKQCSALMAIPLDLRRDVRNADITTSLRSGTTALALAVDTIKAGTAKSVLVTASDTRMGAPASMLEQGLGDGAAAFLLGTQDVIAEIEDMYTISDELAGQWRSASDTYVRAWEDRMVLEKGYSKTLPEAMSGLMKKTGHSPMEIKTCQRWLDRQLEVIQPKLVVTLGRYSMARFFPGATISKVHGKERSQGGITYYAMYHPAAALHQQNLRQTIQTDMLRIPALLQQAADEVPEPEQEPKQLSMF